MNYGINFKEDMINTVNNGYIERRREKENFQSEIRERMEFAFSVLNFNQNLIQFAETKANTLLLVNSIFLATVTGMMEGNLSQTFAGHIFIIVRMLFLITTICSVIMCLLVVIPKSDDPAEAKKRDMIFFMDILQYNNAGNYTYEFHKTRTSSLLDDILKRCYMISHIASSKFYRYRISQNMTFLSTFLWLADICMYYMK